MSWIQTFSGKDFSFNWPRAESIELIDIAHSLAYQCRFNGHVQRYYSIAEHSYWATFRAADIASALVKEGKIQRDHGVAITVTALMHDAAEAYVGDMVRPLKNLPGMELFSDIEQSIIRIIQDKYKFPVDQIALDVVKQADEEMLALERRDVMGPCDRPWEGIRAIPDPSFVEIECWGPETAKAKWLRTAKALGLR